MRKPSYGGFAAINLACGGKLCHEPGWINADHAPSNRELLKVDLLKPLGFPDCTFDAVYHSQFIEHLSADKAASFLRECHRILKPDGVLRIVTPDLQNQATEYLSALDAVLARPRDEALKLRYDWIRLEMLDQLVRHKSGGEMVKFLDRSGRSIDDYLSQRMGRSGRNLIPQIQESDRSVLKHALRNFRNRGRTILDRVTPKALQVGRFRLSGEAHLCMYDEYSLSGLLGELGFVNIKRVSATTSRIPNWNRTRLDCDDQGHPDCAVSLFMEAGKTA